MSLPPNVDIPDPKDPEESTPELYHHALEHFLKGEPKTTLRLLKEAWENRSDLDSSSEAYPSLLNAGVCLTALYDFFEFEDKVADALPDADDVLETVAPDRDRFSPAIEPLFEYQSEGETDTMPEDLRATAEKADDELAQLEALAAGTLLEGPD